MVDTSAITKIRLPQKNLIYPCNTTEAFQILTTAHTRCFTQHDKETGNTQGAKFTVS